MTDAQVHDICQFLESLALLAYLAVLFKGWPRWGSKP